MIDLGSPELVTCPKCRAEYEALHLDLATYQCPCTLASSPRLINGLKVIDYLLTKHEGMHESRDNT
jgi:hypothetical protein